MSDSEHMDLTVVRYTRKTPLHEKVLYVVGALGFLAAILFNNWR